MSYIDAVQRGDRVMVRVADGDKRRNVSFNAPYDMYVPAADGDAVGIDGVTVGRIDFPTREELDRAKAVLQGEKIPTYESDVSPVYKVIEREFRDKPIPDIRVAVFDIEVDRDPSRGFARFDDPYAPITAISVRRKWEGNTYTIIIPPPGVSVEEYRAILANGNDEFGTFSENERVMVVSGEAELLYLIPELFRGADIITGWNSEFYDIPYIVQRTRIVLGGENIRDVVMDYRNAELRDMSQNSKRVLRNYSPFDMFPRVSSVLRYGNYETTYTFPGLVHIDYLALYRKFTYQERDSYTLDSVLEDEIGQRKVAYEGSLDELYREDPVRFVAYSRQDVDGLSDLDDSLRFMSVANEMAHQSCTLFKDVLASVNIIDKSIICEAHRIGKVLPDCDHYWFLGRYPDGFQETKSGGSFRNVGNVNDAKITQSLQFPIPGGYVLTPSAGKYDWIASYDFNSLYPTVIRFCNICPETIVGIVMPFDTIRSVLEMESRNISSAQAWGNFIGTLEYQRVVDGSHDDVHVIWYSNDDNFGIRSGDTTVSPAKDVKEIIEKNGYIISGFGVIYRTDVEGIIPYCLSKWYQQRKEYKKKASQAWDAGDSKEHEYWDTRQLVQKIFLNSTYGAFLNVAFRLYSPYLGASVTMTGRICLKTMVDEIEYLMANKSGDLISEYKKLVDNDG